MLPPFFKTNSVFQRKHCEIACWAANWAANWATPMLACAGGAIAFFFRRLRAGSPPRSVRSETIGRGRQLPILGKFAAKFRSFSAVSKRILQVNTRLTAFFKNLPDYLAEILKFGKSLQILRHLQNVG